MKTPLAWRNTVHNKVRTAAAVAGVAFAILLVFMQLGFYGACRISATLVYDLVEFDAVIVSPQYVHLRKTGAIPNIRLRQAVAVPGVLRADPLYVLDAAWRNPVDFFKREVLVLGVDPNVPMFRIDQINRSLHRIIRPGTAIMDQKAQPIFGPHNPGTITEVNEQRIEIVDGYQNGTGFIAGAVMVVSANTFHRLMNRYPLNQPQLGLVRLSPGADVRQTLQQLRETLGPDVQVLSRKELEDKERNYFVNIKPIGFMFKSGVLIGFLVGAVILYQILAAEITNHIRQFATLKAIGYGSWYLNLLVIKQGVYFALLGFFPAFILAIGLYWIVRTLATIPMYLTVERVILVLLLSIGMCAVSGVLAVRKLQNADPADLF